MLRPIAFLRALVLQFSRGGGYCFLNGDAARQALIQRSTSYAVDTARCRKAYEDFPIYLDFPQVPFVLGALLKGRCPSAIIRRVALFWVKAVYGMTQARALSHIPQKRHERPIPPVAYGDTASPVFRKVFALRVAASPLHREPNPVGGARPVSFMSVFHGCLHTGDHSRRQLA